MELPAAVFRINVNDNLDEQLTKSKNEYEDILIFPGINKEIVLRLVEKQAKLLAYEISTDRYSIGMLTAKLQVPGLFDVTVHVLKIT